MDADKVNLGTETAGRPGSNLSIGAQIAELRAEKAEIEDRLEVLTNRAKVAAAKGEDVSCADYEVTVRVGGTKSYVKAEAVRGIEALLPPDVYAGLWSQTSYAAVYVKRRAAPMVRRSRR